MLHEDVDMVSRKEDLPELHNVRMAQLGVVHNLVRNVLADKAPLQRLQGHELLCADVLHKAYTAKGPSTQDLGSVGG